MLNEQNQGLHIIHKSEDSCAGIANAEVMDQLLRDYQWLLSMDDLLTTRTNNKDMQLTPREQEVLDLLSEGLTANEIANELYISNHTAVSHRKNLMRKLKVHNRAKLIKVAFEQGFLRINEKALMVICLVLTTLDQW